MIGRILLGQSVCHDAKVHEQVGQSQWINALCSEISQGARSSASDLFNEGSISFTGDFKEGLQERGHLQDLDWDLPCRFIGSNCCGVCRGHMLILLRLVSLHRVLFEHRTKRRCSKPMPPVIGELRAESIIVQCVSPSVTEVSNNAIEENPKDFDLVYPWRSVSSTRTSRENPPIVKGRSRTLKRMEWTTRCRGWP